MRFRSADLLYNKMEKCNICPRGCGVDRNIKTGFCGEKNTVRLARAALHYWEEPCISGEKGSGTVFFSGCNLRCVYCQNYGISRGEALRRVRSQPKAAFYAKKCDFAFYNDGDASAAEAAAREIDRIAVGEESL